MMMDYLRVSIASKKYGIKQTKLERLALTRELISKKIGPEWFIDESDLQRYLQETSLTVTPIIGTPLFRSLTIGLAILTLIVSINFFERTQTIQKFDRGQAALGEILENLTQKIKPTGNFTINQSFAKVIERLIQLQTIGQNWLINIQDFLNLFFQKIVRNWQFFLNGGLATSGAAGQYLNLNENTRAILKQEIAEELRSEFNQYLKLQGETGQTSEENGGLPNRGLIVVPSGGEPSSDAALKNNLQNMFSDEVRVNFDPSGQTGVITPIFRRAPGNNYLFILTPIKPSTP